MSGNPLLRAERVEIGYGPRRVLHGVDLEVQAGEVVVLVGPNGAGKSTLLAALAGDLAPSAGRVLLDGDDVAALRARPLARRRAVMVQESQVAFGFRVADVVAMGRWPWAGASVADDAGATAAAMAVADVTSLAGRNVRTLSGGERARTAFARLLAQGTELLLLDEPTASLDIRHQEGALQAVRERAAAGAGAVVALHDLSLAAAYADRVVVLEDGHVRGDGPPREVLTPALLSAVYRHRIEVLPRPGTDELVVLPVREVRA